MDPPKYLPSLSTGIYGSYVIKNIAEHKQLSTRNIHTSTSNLNDEKEIDQKSDVKEELRQLFFKENKDDEIPADKLYYAAKEIDDKFKLYFKPECNYKGCCNKPEISGKLLKGDMYICKKHRIEMANDLKKTHGDNPIIKPIILKLKTYTDQQYYQEGNKLEQDDFFLKNYTKTQQLKLKVAKKLSEIEDQMSTEYWDAMICYKQLEDQAKLLCNIRKIANPYWLPLIGAAVVVAAVVGAYYLCKWAFGGGGGGGGGSETKQQREEREKREAEQKKKIEECQAAFDKLNKEFSDNLKLKKECYKIIAEKLKEEVKKQNEIINKKQEIADIINKIDAETVKITKANIKIAEYNTEISNEVNTIKAREAEINAIASLISRNEAQLVNYQNELKSFNDEIDGKTAEINGLKDKIQNVKEQAKGTSVKEMLGLLKEVKAMQDELRDHEDALEEKKDERQKKQQEFDKLQQEQDKKQREKEQKENDKIAAEARKKEAEALKKEQERLKSKAEEEKERLEQQRQQREEELERLKMEKEKLEQERREKERQAREAERREDEINWERAENRAEYACRNTSSGRVALYVVYDKRQPFQSWTKTYYGSRTRDDTWNTEFGNYWICKMEADYSKNGWNEFRFKTSGRSTYWYRYVNGNCRTGTSGDWTYIEL